MKKILLTLIIIPSAFLISNCRSFTNYTPDGEGGIYRKGNKYFWIYNNSNYVEHCKKEGAELKCTALDVTL